MITRKVHWQDASSAGFTYNWVKKIAERLEKLYVLTWQKSQRGDLPANIEIASLSGNKFKKIFTIQKELLKILPKVDGVFCHQNPEYTILAALLAKIYGKKIVSWYTHKQVTWKLHLVNLLANKILTASKESCRLRNRKKIEVVGHGIDVEIFTPVILSKVKNPVDIPRDPSSPAAPQDDIIKNQKFTILSVGRISPVKDYETLIEAIAKIVPASLQVQIIGGPGLKEDEKYFEKLQQLVREKNLEDYIKFLGPVPHHQIVPYYQNSDLLINLSHTGSLDKAVLEAMACQCLVLTSNEAFAEILPAELIIEESQAQKLATKINWLIELSEDKINQLKEQLRQEVVENHNLDKLVEKIIKGFL